MDVFRKAYVYVRHVFSGILEETESGYMFTYDREYLENEAASAVSITLPVRVEPYISNILFPFFDGLIPEGWLLNAVSKNWKIDNKDRFGLLLVACKDGIGNVTIQENRV